MPKKNDDFNLSKEEYARREKAVEKTIQEAIKRDAERLKLKDKSKKISKVENEEDLDREIKELEEKIKKAKKKEKKEEPKKSAKVESESEEELDEGVKSFDELESNELIKIAKIFKLDDLLKKNIVKELNKKLIIKGGKAFLKKGRGVTIDKDFEIETCEASISSLRGKLNRAREKESRLMNEFYLPSTTRERKDEIQDKILEIEIEKHNYITKINELNEKIDLLSR